VEKLCKEPLRALHAAVGFLRKGHRTCKQHSWCEAAWQNDPCGQDLRVGGQQPTSANPLQDLHQQLLSAAAQMGWRSQISSLSFPMFFSQEEIT